MKKLLFFILFFNRLFLFAQVNCNTTDLNTIPGKWTWEKDGTAAQWQYTGPIRKEILRIMPKPVDGLVGAGSIAFWDQNAFFKSPSPRSFEFYFIIKKYECLNGYNKIQPEGETGCWIYFLGNDIEGVKFPLENAGIMYSGELGSNLLAMNIEIRQDAAGNQLLYTSSKPGIFIPHCYYFSARKGLPRRKISNRELFTSYKSNHEKLITENILRFEKMIVADEKTYNALSAKEKSEQPYWLVNGKKNKEILAGFRADREKVLNWYNGVLKRKDLDSLAYVKTINESRFDPQSLEAIAGNGFNVWAENPAFFDPGKPKDELQCLSLYIRRQDSDKPKKAFMDLFFSQFNLDVLAKLTGEPVKKNGSINTLHASISDRKTATTNAQASTGNKLIRFDNSATGEFPAGWEGEKNISVKKVEGINQLAIDKKGYWFPRQYNQEIKDKFSLSFDLSWDKAMPYYNGLFTVSFGQVLYDNPSEDYRTDLNPSSFWSLYDSYAGNYNRVVCWFDATGNNAGTLQIASYLNNESQVANKKITLPGFFGDKNKHTVALERKGNNLLVYIDKNKEAEVENAFIPAARYNIFTFSRYKGSDDAKDVYYLNNINTSY